MRTTLPVLGPNFVGLLLNILYEGEPHAELVLRDCEGDIIISPLSELVWSEWFVRPNGSDDWKTLTEVNCAADQKRRGSSHT